jgi:hypothetical protein
LNRERKGRIEKRPHFESESEDWYRYDSRHIKRMEGNGKMPDLNSNPVQLGCGTLIIIALIVMIFSGRSNVDELKGDVQELTKQVVMLQQKVDTISRCK